jgi:hypothetical protein
MKKIVGLLGILVMLFMSSGCDFITSQGGLNGIWGTWEASEQGAWHQFVFNRNSSTGVYSESSSYGNYNVPFTYSISGDVIVVTYSSTWDNSTIVYRGGDEFVLNGWIYKRQ